MSIDNYLLIENQFGITIDRDKRLIRNYCQYLQKACWNHSDSFKYSINFFGIIEIYKSSGELSYVEEGLFTNGLRNGLTRYSSYNESFVGWFKDGRRHGRMMSVDAREPG